MRQRSIIDQLIHIKDCVINEKPIKVIGIPDGWTPHDLTTHYIELYNILDESKKQPDHILKAWLGNAKTREDLVFTTKKEIEILEELTYD